MIQHGGRLYRLALHGVTLCVTLTRMKQTAIPDQLAAQATEIRLTVAANLDSLLEQNRWSRRAAALALGLTHRYVNSRATGEVELSSSDLAMFADFLGVPITRFFEPTHTTKGPTFGKIGPLRLPDLDSNQEPAVISLASHRHHFLPVFEPDNFPSRPNWIAPVINLRDHAEHLPHIAR